MSGLEIELFVPRAQFNVEVALVADGAVGLTGASGAGKSSILRAVAGLEPEATGHIAVGGEEWLSAGRSVPCELRDAGYLGQADGLFPHLTARENIVYTVRASGAARRTAQEAAEHALAELGLEPIGDYRPAKISGGQRRRVALARALAPRRAAYLIDEPFAGLDEEAADAAARFIASRLLEHDAPALIAGHDVDRLDRICGRVERIDRGRVTGGETVSDSIARPRAQESAAVRRSTGGRPAGFPGDSR